MSSSFFLPAMSHSDSLSVELSLNAPLELESELVGTLSSAMAVTVTLSFFFLSFLFFGFKRHVLLVCSPYHSEYFTTHLLWCLHHAHSFPNFLIVSGSPGFGALCIQLSSSLWPEDEGLVVIVSFKYVFLLSSLSFCWRTSSEFGFPS